VNAVEQWATASAIGALAVAYGLQIRAVLPLRSVVGLLTDQGKLMGKRYTLQQGVPEERLRAIAQVRAQLAQAGVGPAYLRTVEGQDVWSYDHCPITVEPWLPGRHVDLRVATERQAAVQAVARLHAARVDVPYELRHPPTLLQKLGHRLQRVDELVENGGLVGLTPVQWRVWRKRAQDALRSLPVDELSQLNREERARGGYCHRDLAPHNILLRDGYPARLIDFDLSGVDSILYDLHQLFGHVSYAAPTIAHFERPLLEAYARIAPLSDRHVKMLDALAPFPALLLRELSEVQGMKRVRSVQRVTARIRFACHVEERRLRTLARAGSFVVC